MEKDLDLTLKQLGTDYLDLYLIHWPVAFKPGDDLFPKTADGKADIDWETGVVETWKEVVRISKETKKVRAVGVSNFSIKYLDKIIDATGEIPAVLQIEANPSVIQPELYEYARKKGIVITAYSPLGNNVTGKPKVIESDEVKSIAKRLNKEPAQVLIAWAIKHGFSVIPKSVTPSRIKSNFETFDLPDEDFQLLENWGKKNYDRANIPSQYDPSWPVNVFDEPSEKQYKPAP